MTDRNIFGESLASEPAGDARGYSFQQSHPTDGREMYADGNGAYSPDGGTYVDAYPSDEPSTATPRIPPGTYADDDSVVSSAVSSDPSDPEVAVLTRAGDADIENATVPVDEEKKGILPRNRREWCIVLLAILLILAVAVGTGLGIGYAFSRGNGSNEETTTVESGRAGGDGSAPTQGDDSTVTSTPAPGAGQDPSLSGPQGPPFDDLGSAIEYHVISQGISDAASFAGGTSEGNGEGNGEDVGGDFGGPLSAQERARDFLVFGDTLPLAVMDEDEEQTDDPLAITDAGRTRPYLTPATPAYRVAQRFAAAVLFHATNGGDWTTSRSWMEPGVHECDFVGVTCEEVSIPSISLEEALLNPGALPRYDDGTVDATTERMIVAVDLPENNMGGYLPQEIMALPYLQRLGLWSNGIDGPLPAQLGRLRQLRVLLLDDNRLRGAIPRELGRLSSLTDLSLAHNPGIGGRIPAELGDLSNLERLELSHMNLRGGIPAELGNLRGLTGLYLNDNRLGRNLPDELKNLRNLENLVLSGNEFTGGIPASWRALRRLRRLEVQGNALEFEVDERFCALRDEGTLEALVADCGGEARRDMCSCCTECVP